MVLVGDHTARLHLPRAMKPSIGIAGLAVGESFHQTLVLDRFVICPAVNIERILQYRLVLPSVAPGHDSRHLTACVEACGHIVVFVDGARVQFQTQNVGVVVVARSQQDVTLLRGNTIAGQTIAKHLVVHTRLVDVGGVAMIIVVFALVVITYTQLLFYNLKLKLKLN